MNTRAGRVPVYIVILSAGIVLMLLFGLWLRTPDGLCWSIQHNVLQTARWQAAVELSAGDARAQQCLLLAMHHADPNVREAALHGITWGGNVNLLVEAARVADPEARAQILPALAARVQGGSFEVVPTFTSALSDPSPAVRRAAVEGLGRIGPSTESLSVILPLTEDHDGLVRDAAIGALAATSGAAGIAKVLRSDLPESRRAALSVLWRSTSMAAQLVPELENIAANDPDAEARRMAQDLLKSLRLQQDAKNRASLE